MPEEVNRVMVDTISDVLFATEASAMRNLEGVAGEAHMVGNTMIDTLVRFLPKANYTRWWAGVMNTEQFGLLTIHRPANLEGPQGVEVRQAIASMAGACGMPIVWPVHPRARFLAEGLKEQVRITDPLSYLEFIAALNSAAFVVTDSGGVQDEACYLGVPCYTLRPSTERPITLAHGNRLVWPPEQLAEVVSKELDRWSPLDLPAPPGWDGKAATRIAEVLSK